MSANQEKRHQSNDNVNLMIENAKEKMTSKQQESQEEARETPQDRTASK